MLKWSYRKYLLKGDRMQTRWVTGLNAMCIWDVKAVINGTLSLVDVLAKAYHKQKKELMLLIVQTLAQQVSW